MNTINPSSGYSFGKFLIIWKEEGILVYRTAFVDSTLGFEPTRDYLQYGKSFYMNWQSSNYEKVPRI